LYSKIDKFIGIEKSKYRVLSIGIHPATALYNGFYTLDGYFMTFPLKYKLEFRKIIEKELSKNKELKNWFDEWGSRCYAVPSELGGYRDIIYSKKKNIKLKDLQLNSEAIKNMGGKYIFSSMEILNYKENNLKFLKKFDAKESIWEIYLYKVI
jgi:hypothetical protein